VSNKLTAVTRAQARELKRIDERMSREGGTPHELIRQEWLADMAAELRRMVDAFERTGRGAKELLEALVVAETEGADATVLADVRRELGQRVKKRRGS
jgi:hypothetical protein